MLKVKFKYEYIIYLFLFVLLQGKLERDSIIGIIIIASQVVVSKICFISRFDSSG